MKNEAVAEILFEIADVLELKKVQWKPIAYRRAARSIQSMSEDVASIYKEGGIKALDEIPGVGKGIAAKIEEFLKTGKIKEYQKLKKSVPKGVEELMHIPGLGPKRALALAKKLKVKSRKDLESAAKAGRVKKLAGFGARSEEEILRGLTLVKKGEDRSGIGRMLPFARELENVLNRLPFVKQAIVAGSLRRRRETIRDIDILVSSTKPNEVMEAFRGLKTVKHVLAKGPTKCSVVFEGKIQSDLRVLNPKVFGAALMYFTGSKEHNVALRKIAIKKKMKLSEYGLFSGKKLVAGKTEQEIYKRLGMQYVPPELREARGEVEAALNKKLPRLLELKDIKGDLHLHTNASDGNASIADMVKAAKKQGYSYCAITDHSQTRKIAGGLEVKRLRRHIKEVSKVNRSSRLKVFKGAEVDILGNGSLDYPDSVLKDLDIVIASIHSGFRAAKEKMTKRILRALENKHVNVLAHPTGRLINTRNPYQVDLKKVFKAAKDNNVALEINSFPKRLDLRDAHVKAAIDEGCKLIINTDSHSPDHLKFIEYGVATARRGWAQKKNVVNTYTLRRFESWL